MASTTSRKSTLSLTTEEVHLFNQVSRLYQNYMDISYNSWIDPRGAYLKYAEAMTDAGFNPDLYRGDGCFTYLDGTVLQLF